MRQALFLPLALALAGCGDQAPASDNAAGVPGFVPPAPQPAQAIPGQSQTTPISAYVGHYPRDAVDGVAFFDRIEVASAIDQVMSDDVLRRAIVRAEGPTTPIFRVGDRAASWGCAQHDCADRNWTVIVDDEGRGEVCYHDADSMGPRSRWYRPGGTAMRAGDCPSGGATSAPAATPTPTPATTPATTDDAEAR